MQAYTEILPPTAVTHAINIPLINPEVNNLVVAKTSLLQIFEILHVENKDHRLVNGTNGDLPQALARRASGPHETASRQSKIALIGEYPLSGTITSLAGIKISSTKSGGHALLIAFKDAKISLVEWDPEQHSLSTISVHYYEGEDFQSAPWAEDFGNYSTFLTVDPGNRCAALKFSLRHLAIVPFKQSGDDLVIGDYDPDLDTPPQSAIDAPKTNGDVSRNETPYSASFVLPLTVLDPALVYPVDLAFLYEYREPTIGILSSAKLSSNALLEKRKDMLSYTVFTLDLEQRARTPLLSVTGLPYDLFMMKPLPPPIGGVLLIGGNELIHIDQAGKPNAVGVNEFAKQCSNFAMTDSSDLGLRLECCAVEQLSKDTGDVILILASGELVILSFKVDGRSVSGLSLQKVPPSHGGHPLSAPASCVANLDQNSLFIGSYSCDALIISHSRKAPQLTRKRSHAEMLGLDDENISDEDLEDEDDLYGEGNSSNRQVSQKNSTSISSFDLTFAIDDRLLNLAPAGDVSFAIYPGEGNSNIAKETVDIVLPTGSGADGRLSFINEELHLDIVQDLGLHNVEDVFSITLKTPSQNDKSSNDYQEFVIASQLSTEGQESSTIYAITQDGYEKLTETDLETEYMTTNVHAVHGGRRIVQVCKSNIKTLGPDFKLAQMFDLENENGQELNVVHTSFLDPYFLVLRDDYSAVVFKADSDGEYEELEELGGIATSSWISGALHKTDASTDPFLYLLSADGVLHAFPLSDPSHSNFTIANMSSLPPILSSDALSRRTYAKANLTEVLVADLGDTFKRSSYLIVRSKSNDVTVYEPYHFPSGDLTSFTANLKWTKVLDFSVNGDAHIEPENDEEYGRMRQIDDINGLCTVFVPGQRSCLLVKNTSSSPRAIPLTPRSTRSLDCLQGSKGEQGIIYVNGNGRAHTSNIPQNTDLSGTGCVVHNVRLGENVTNVCYHAESGLFILATDTLVDFVLPEDSHHKEWQDETTSFRPKVKQGAVKVMAPSTRTIIDEVALEEYEQVLSVKALNLLVSEFTQEKKDMIVVATAICRGESLNCNGSIYVFDIVDVVPDPDRPETNQKLKLIVREEVKAPVTAMSEIGDEGFLVAAQGQKCIVRGLKEDNTLLPVAFLDMQCYVTVLKTLSGPGGVGMALMGDVAKGLWFAGYAPEPYRMTIFGKSRAVMDVASAEFLPHEKELFLVMADADCDIHVLQYNPEDPQSLQGQRLLNRTRFRSGHFASSMALLPSSRHTTADITNGEPPPILYQQHQVLISSTSGALQVLTPLSETTYRRLGALQNHLTAILDHTAGLNPKAYRAIESEGFGSRGLLDGDVLRRWAELGTQRRAEAGSRVGAENWEVRQDLARIGHLG